MYFHIGAYEEAINCFGSVTNTYKNNQVLYLRAKTLIITKELNNAMLDLQKIQEQNNDLQSWIDLSVLTTLKATSSQNDEGTFLEAASTLSQLIKKNADGKIFQKSDILFYKGVYQFYLGMYEDAQMCLKQSYDIKEE